MASVESMPTAATPTPKTPIRNTSLPPAQMNETRIATTTQSSGIQVEIMPSATPAMMTVAGPVWACSLMFCVGLCS